MLINLIIFLVTLAIAAGLGYGAIFISGFLASMLTGFLVFLVVVMSLVILFLQGKGDMGAAGSWQSGQVVFGGSGGQDVIAKTIWVMVALFFILSTAICKIEQTKNYKSVFGKYMSTSKAENNQSAPISPEDFEEEE